MASGRAASRLTTFAKQLRVSVTTAGKEEGTVLFRCHPDDLETVKAVFDKSYLEKKSSLLTGAIKALSSGQARTAPANTTVAEVYKLALAVSDKVRRNLALLRARQAKN